MSRFLDEIGELPAALERLLSFYRTGGRDRLAAWVEATRGRDHILFSGMGTSGFAPLSIRHRLAAVGVALHAIDAGEWLHYPVVPPREANNVVLISQSGESVEVRRLVERELPGPGYVAVTNDEFSTVARHAGLVLPLHAGDEAAISTKTYTNTLALLLLMAGALESDAELDELFDLMGCVSGALLPENGDALAELAEFLLPGDAIAFVGRGPAFVTARQSALTFMEGARCLTSAFTGGDFRHGPFEAVGPDFRMVVFAPGGWTTTYSEALAREAASLGARVVLVTDHSLPEQDNLRVLRIANIAGPDAESLFPLIASGVMPVLLYHLARARGTEAGEFRYGAKITTRE